MVAKKVDQAGFDGLSLKEFCGRDTIDFDFDITSFPVQDKWTSLDLSKVIPSETKLVHFQCGIVANDPANYIAFRKKGYVGEVAQSVCSQYPGLEIWGTFWVEPDTNGLIEYYNHCPTATWMGVAIYGWFE